MGQIYSMFSTYMPQWPREAVSALTRIVGGDSGAVVFFTNSAGMFGNAEIQSVGVATFADGKIVRWTGHWDARHFGVPNFEALRTPDAKYPADFRETHAVESAEPAFANLVARFTDAAKKRIVTGPCCRRSRPRG
jgi:hypothetical protein